MFYVFEEPHPKKFYPRGQLEIRDPQKRHPHEKFLEKFSHGLEPGNFGKTSYRGKMDKKIPRFFFSFACKEYVGNMEEYVGDCRNMGENMKRYAGNMWKIYGNGKIFELFPH